MAIVPHKKWQHAPERNGEGQQNADERIVAALEKIARILDAFAGAYLNARFSGKGNDRWSRR